eukprot:CAMPEP_0197323012 /NCGR_PEP_ID=MMETSP0891-20130614/70254_1 /TAXON_ID=44058 ORGANISM="Aureoumbra lagunensis, Strain CCMP1510" /NCGR_SAMPLE_ID=MMETSP0891 /ASSEMBLY_ACC=CAM_ASM_000534 /LENGTH=577 /DNA_ID=CAMNT_0042815557 /DNA_START=3279 /DNA_END=5012 /DNA_ORIENTATION=-
MDVASKLATEFWTAISNDARLGYGRDVHCNSFENNDKYYPWKSSEESKTEACVISTEKQISAHDCSKKSFCICESEIRKEAKVLAHYQSQQKIISLGREVDDEVSLVAGTGRRNHGCAVLENDDGKKKLFSILGRWAESAESVALDNGDDENTLNTCDSTLGDEHSGLCNLNHVVALPVRKLDHTTDQIASIEIWLPCGFEGHHIGGEESSKWTRIMDPSTLEIRYGPRVTVAGGACAALALPTETDEDGLICAFGGTDGNHDTGAFLHHVRCYDRRNKKWIQPYENLPIGLDHANAAFVPNGACGKDSKARAIVANFRASHYANMRTEVFGMTLDQGKWHVFANDTGSLPRDAAGAILTPDHRFLIEFGGVYYIDTKTRQAQERILSELKFAIDAIGARVGKASFKRLTQTYHTRLEFDEIRALDLCGSGHWLHIGKMSHPRFATQSCASKNQVYTCGGTTGGIPSQRHDRIDILRSWRENDIQTHNHSIQFLRKHAWLGQDHGNYADCDIHSFDELIAKAETAAKFVAHYPSTSRIFDKLNNFAAASEVSNHCGCYNLGSVPQNETAMVLERKPR